MTSDPKAPDAPAVFLNYDEYVDIKAHFHRVYARIKILTERGKVEFSDVEIPYETGATAIRGIEARTIEPDGTVVSFTGTPIDKEVVKFGRTRVMEKVFSMPNVQVGSIIEYQWERQYDDWYVFPPSWDLQKPIFMHEGHYHFTPLEIDPGSSNGVSVPDGMGHVLLATRLLYDQQLPPGATLKDLPTGIDVAVKDVPPIPDEPFSPPLDSFSYRVTFFYSAQYTGQEFWNTQGRTWSKEVDHFASTTDAIRQIVSQIVSPGDNDEQKARKIFAAVMTLDNTAYSRAHTEEENQAQGAKEKTAADIWEQKRGTPVEIARLFTALARAAGLKVSEMAVTRRDERILNASYLYWGQMNNEIAIVSIDGKDVFLDPGERYSEFGKLAWEHTQVMGIRQSDSGTQPVLTPAAEYKDTVVERKAVLQLAQDGKVDGTIQVSMTGAEALRWRQVALRRDGDEAAREFNGELQRDVPAGIQVTTAHLDNLTDSAQPLKATVQVTGSMGTATGSRVFLPASFFEAGDKPLFAEEKRDNPVDLHYPSATRDQVKITLAAGLTVATVPTDAQIPFPKNAQYVAKYVGSGSVYQQARLLAVGNTVYSKAEYTQLRDFFQKAGAQDQQQVVLQRQPGTAASGQ